MNQPKVSDGQIHVWSLSADPDYVARDTSLVLLSEDERRRYSSFRYDGDRRRYLIFRAGMRQILASYLNQSPEQLRFSYTPTGKPFLSTPSLAFNLSHSRDKALMAVSLTSVGIDIEAIHSIERLFPIADRLFSPQELAALRQGRNTAEHHRLFYQIWCRKEAYVKALGTGIFQGLSTITVLSAASPKSVSPVFDHDQDTGWQCHSLIENTDYISALCTSEPSARISHFSFSQDGVL